MAAWPTAAAPHRPGRSSPVAVPAAALAVGRTDPRADLGADPAGDLAADSPVVGDPVVDRTDHPVAVPAADRMDLRAVDLGAVLAGVPVGVLGAGPLDLAVADLAGRAECRRGCYPTPAAGRSVDLRADRVEVHPPLPAASSREGRPAPNPPTMVPAADDRCSRHRRLRGRRSRASPVAGSLDRSPGPPYVRPTAGATIVRTHDSLANFTHRVLFRTLRSFGVRDPTPDRPDLPPTRAEVMCPSILQFVAVLILAGVAGGILCRLRLLTDRSDTIPFARSRDQRGRPPPGFRITTSSSSNGFPRVPPPRPPPR